MFTKGGLFGSRHNCDGPRYWRRRPRSCDAGTTGLTCSHHRDVTQRQRYLSTLYFLRNARVRCADGSCGGFWAASDCFVCVIRRAIDDGLVRSVGRLGFTRGPESVNPAHCCFLHDDRSRLAGFAFAVCSATHIAFARRRTMYATERTINRPGAQGRVAGTLRKNLFSRSHQ
jgi:hypothetical protein